jgi:hypothetical protein
VKLLLKVFVVFSALNAAALFVPQKACAQQGAVSFQLFYDDLSPYGMWVDYPAYGYVWIPDGGSEFSPYSTNGHWVFTDDGWTWYSGYPWGWATFHYGRWDYDDYYGWFWVPDDQWGPAWVSWRRSPGYYGWAPLRPGVSITVSFGSDYHERNDRWMFVRDRDIDRTDISRHYVSRMNNVTIISNSTVIVNTRKDNRRNTTYITGPGRDDVQRVTGTTIKPAVIREYSQPGQRLNNGELQIYRPQVQKTGGGGRNPAPSRVIQPSDVKPVSERNGRNQQQRSPVVSPLNRDQAPQPRGVRPSDGETGQQRPGAIRSLKKNVALPRQATDPANENEKQQQPEARPPNKVQRPPAKNVTPAKRTEKNRQPQKVDAPQKNRKGEPSKSENKQNENNKGKQESGQ